MKSLDSSLKETEKVYGAIEAEKRVLYFDLAYHLTQAFPGARLQSYESITPAGA